MDRQTIDLKFGDYTFKVKTYATAREAHEIQQATLKGSKIEIIGETPKITDFDPSFQFEVEKELIKQMVVSMDGKTESLVDLVLEIPNDIYNELIDKLDSLVAKKKK